jgi:hypothetical protein
MSVPCRDWKQNEVPYKCKCEGVASRELLSSPLACHGDSNGDESVNPSDVGDVKLWYGDASIESL